MMRTLLLAVTALATSAPFPVLAAQRAARPTLALTIFGGATTGHALWTVDRQPVCVVSGTTCSSQDDTVRLSRKILPSVVLGLAASYFPGATLGVHGQIVYLGLPIDDTCSAAMFVDSRNADLCGNITAASGTGTAFGFFLSATARLAPGHVLSPYLRVGAGVFAYSSSTVEVAGSYTQTGGVRSREIIADAEGGGASASLVAALGLTSPLGPGYQLRIELGDVYSGFDIVTGPASRQGLGASTDRDFFHHAALTIGLDIVLEQKRGRRY